MPGPQPQPRASAWVGAATAAAPSAAAVARGIAVFLIALVPPRNSTRPDNAFHFRWLRGKDREMDALRKFHLDERHNVRGGCGGRSIRAWQAAHGEFDFVTRQLAPAFDLAHVAGRRIRI